MTMSPGKAASLLQGGSNTGLPTATALPIFHHFMRRILLIPALVVALLFPILTTETVSAADSLPVWLKASIAPYCPAQEANVTDSSDCISSLYLSATLAEPNTHTYPFTLTEINDKPLKQPVRVEFEMGPDTNHSSLLRYEFRFDKMMGNSQEKIQLGRECLLEKVHDAELCCNRPDRTFRRFIERQENLYELYQYRANTKFHTVRSEFQIGSMPSWEMSFQDPGQKAHITKAQRVDLSTVVKHDLALGSMQVVSQIPTSMDVWLFRDVREEVQHKEWSDLSSWFVVDPKLSDTRRLDMERAVYEYSVNCHQRENEILQFHSDSSCNAKDQYCAARKNLLEKFVTHSERNVFNPGSVSIQHQGSGLPGSSSRGSAFVSGYTRLDGVFIQMIIRGVEFEDD